jgi:alpha-methylacyl-CoA racemase
MAREDNWNRDSREEFGSKPDVGRTVGDETGLQGQRSRLGAFLTGVRIVDLSRHLPGPLATMLLADMGAEVIKIEAPGGDDQRRIGPRGPDGQSVFFHAVNASKTTRTIDLKSETGRSTLREMTKNADVLIESFRPGVMTRLGVDYESLKAANQGLIYCSLSGYGQAGPCAQDTGHDGNFLALSGIMHRNRQTKPSYYDPPIADCAASLFAAIVILGALRGRESDRKGCHIDMSLADAPMALQMFQLAHLGVSGVVPSAAKGYLNGGAAYYQVYETSDHRHVMLGAIERKLWVLFCEAAERPDWIERHQESEPQSDLIRDVAAVVAGWTLKECEQRFGKVDCGLSPVLDLGEAVRHPHHRQRGMLALAPLTGFQALFPALIDGRPPVARSPIKAWSDAPL